MKSPIIVCSHCPLLCLCVMSVYVTVFNMFYILYYSYPTVPVAWLFLVLQFAPCMMECVRV